MALDGWDNAETIGNVMADKRGFYSESSLAVYALSPSGPAAAIPDVIGRTDEFGVAHGPEVVLQKEKGAPIVIVGSVVPEPTAAMIWLADSGIEDVGDLEGKTIAIPGLFFQKAFLKRILEDAGLTMDDVKVKSVENNLVPALVEGKADAIFGGSGNLEGAELESHGLKPVVTPVGDLGIPAYEELVLVARTDRAVADRQRMCAVVSAIAHGVRVASQDPSAAVEALKTSGESNPEISRSSTKAQVDATIPLLSDSGYANPIRVERLADWMYEEGMIKREPPLATLIANPKGGESKAAGS
ncbi:MAG: putative hydroxymethylpyrimidine transport system substrate-binding protein [Solirubrobacterales bacterium]|jgi:putative hydroxymethylpyrimidine transport system substrate-binding protein|nr:putative hydroxymethylpyrimidine transport system substrate-binding protein [Solirubrobacterales bacterium]